MKKITTSFLILLLTSNFANAIEVRVGKGTFSWQMGIEKFMNVDFDLNVKQYLLQIHMIIYLIVNTTIFMMPIYTFQSL